MHVNAREYDVSGIVCMKTGRRTEISLRSPLRLSSSWLLLLLLLPSKHLLEESELRVRKHWQRKEPAKEQKRRDVCSCHG